MTQNRFNGSRYRRGPVHAYLKAGLLIHMVTLLDIAVLGVFGPDLLWFRAESRSDAVRNTLILVFPVSVLILSQLDARSRFQSYKRVKDGLFTYGFDPRIVKPVLKSRCQRDAALAAADELGYKDLCLTYFRSKGYRWYHVLPDFVFSNPGLLADSRFWRSTFFSETYRSRTGG